MTLLSRRGNRLAAVFTVALWLVACGTDSSEGAGASDATGVTADAAAGGATDSGGAGAPDTNGGGSTYFRTRILRAQCAYNQRCKSTPAVYEADCLASADHAEQSSLFAYDEAAAIAAGRMALDEARLAACIESLTKTGGCSGAEVPLAFTECNRVLVGKIEPGGECFGYSECANGYCERPSTSPDGCPGTCRALVAAGEPCTSPLDCPEGTSCREICEGECKQICFVPKTLGEPCGGAVFCANGFFCDRPSDVPLAFDTPGTCAKWPDEGQPCREEDGFPCPLDLICDRNLAEPTCTARHGVGGACGSHDFCDDGLACDGGSWDFITGKTVIEGKCVVPFQVGEACTPYDPANKQVSGCVNFSECDPVSKTCVTGAALSGQECGMAGTAEYCTPGFTCDTESNRCGFERGLGETCSVGGTACVYKTTCSASGTCDLTCE